MDTWRTISSFPKAEFQLKHQDKCLFLGSCFASNIAEKMTYHGFDSSCNPLGIMYNPRSILRGLQIMKGDKISSEGYVQRQDLYFHHELHSELFATSEDDLKTRVKDIQATFKKDGSQFSTLFVTLGTAWIYKQKELNLTVANCHKVPAIQFEKVLMTVGEIKSTLSQLLNEVGKNVNVVFTISPVRHLKDGVVENQVSKARLIAATYDTVKENEKASYFPSYEIMMDDLRDYRFYADDMLHPSDQAINYIWDRFSDVYFSTKEVTINKEIEKLKKMSTHKPLFDQSEEHQIFKKNLKNKLENFRIMYPHITI